LFFLGKLPPPPLPPPGRSPPPPPLFGFIPFLLFFFLGFSGSTKSVTSGHYYIPSASFIN
jgi:hypothetical protein